LFEYIFENENNIQAIWLANNLSEKKEIEAFGGTSVLRNSFKGKRLIIEAKVGIISMGLGDIGHPILDNMLIVHLFHGIPLKKISLDTSTDTELFSGMHLLNKFNRWILKRSLNRYDLLIAASGLCRKRFKSSFGLPEERIPVCGQPRVDLLYHGCQYPHEKERCKELPERFILYVPTWRESGKNPVDFLKLQRWDEMLAESNYRLVIKLHPLTKSSTNQERQYAHIDFMTDTNIEFTHLLYHTDILITDYSSAMFDFSLLGRPIHIFAPDLEEYESTRGMYESIKELGGEIVYQTEVELLNAVNKSIQSPDEFQKQAKQIADKYYDCFDGKNCERVIEIIVEEMDVSWNRMVEGKTKKGYRKSIK
jgi:CDP-glycerol glycerophosphotransferase